ncbi:MAG TPA: VWA domain-containing protein [Blastocatellia bacterium]|nr:VWA domain-containing protein [Blastocatellia bacterium]
MKYLSGRLAYLFSVLVTFSFLIGAFQVPSLARAYQQRPDKPKLQKPQQSKDESSTGKDDDKDAIRIGTDLVLLDVTVLDPANKPVMDLRENDFAVTEDKVPQKIEFFSREQVPVSLVYAIDTSGSMRPKLETVVKASINLAKESRPGDEMGVIEFKDQPELLEEFTGDVNDVIDTLNGLVASRQTAMLDALYLAADYASKEGKNRRKAVLVVTDGLDNDSFYKFGEVVNHLREIEVQIYLVGFINDLDKDSGLFKKSPKEKAENLLTKLAEETGGKAFFPKELSEVHAIAEQISTDLRTQYSIGYYPTNSKKDGSFRAVKVQVNSGARRLVARTRNGYVAAPRETDTKTLSK